MQRLRCLYTFEQVDPSYQCIYLLLSLGAMISYTTVNYIKDTRWRMLFGFCSSFVGLLMCHTIAKLWPIILLYYYL